MMYFQKRRPRGFQHTFVYVDERKEAIRRLREGRASMSFRPEHRSETSGFAIRLGVALAFVLALAVTTLCLLAG